LRKNHFPVASSVGSDSVEAHLLDITKFWITTESGTVLVEHTRDKFLRHLEQLIHISRRTEITTAVLEQYQMNEAPDLNVLVMDQVEELGGAEEVLKSKPKMAKLLSSFEKIMLENLEVIAKDAEEKAALKEKQEAANKNRRKYIYQAFTELGFHSPERDIVTGVLQLSGVGIKAMKAEETAVSETLSAMGKEGLVGWIKRGPNEPPTAKFPDGKPGKPLATPGIVLFKNEKGQPIDATKDLLDKVQDFRPLRGRGASND
jgi:hypothetical protein